MRTFRSYSRISEVPTSDGWRSATPDSIADIGRNIDETAVEAVVGCPVGPAVPADGLAVAGTVGTAGSVAEIPAVVLEAGVACLAAIVSAGVLSGAVVTLVGVAGISAETAVGGSAAGIGALHPAGFVGAVGSVEVVGSAGEPVETAAVAVVRPAVSGSAVGLAGTVAERPVGTAVGALAVHSFAGAGSDSVGFPAARRRVWRDGALVDLDGASVGLPK